MIPYITRRHQLTEQMQQNQQQMSQSLNMPSTNVLIPLKLAYINTNLTNLASSSSISNASVMSMVPAPGGAGLGSVDVVDSSSPSSSRFIEIYSPISQRNSSLFYDTAGGMMMMSQSYLTSSSSPPPSQSLSSSLSASPAAAHYNGVGSSANTAHAHMHTQSSAQRHLLLPAKNFSYFSLRFSDLSTAMYWLNRITTIVEKLSVQAIQETNQLFQMANKTHSFNLKHLGWLDEQVIANPLSTSMQQITQSLSFGNAQSNLNNLKVVECFYFNPS